MRIGIASVQVPYIHGGAEHHVQGLSSALRRMGHDVEIITMPFRFSPVPEVIRSMDIWSGENFEEMNGFKMDLAICLKFPTYYLKHPNKVVWLMHQYRSVYELWDTPYTEGFADMPEGVEIKERITIKDSEAFSDCRKVFTISKEVSARLNRFNSTPSTPIYHPPKLAERFYNSGMEPFIFYPSRLEKLKRQDLLIDAMKYVQSPVVALIAGEGGMAATFQDKIVEIGAGSRVRLLGQINEDELLACYANCLGVFFGPYKEDYGYVTLEAMLSSKAVITCVDSGGPLEFVENDETGFIVSPDPKEIAIAIDKLYMNQRKALHMGKAGLQRYTDLNISWQNVLEEILR